MLVLFSQNSWINHLQFPFFGIMLPSFVFASCFAPPNILFYFFSASRHFFGIPHPNNVPTSIWCKSRILMKTSCPRHVANLSRLNFLWSWLRDRPSSHVFSIGLSPPVHFLFDWCWKGFFSKKSKRTIHYQWASIPFENQERYHEQAFARHCQRCFLCRSRHSARRNDLASMDQVIYCLW